MNVNNVIVVRFSLKLSPEWQRIAYGSEENRAQWLEKRANIFQETMYKSIMSQTVRPAALVLLLDESDRSFYESFFGNDEGIVKPVFSKNNNHYEQVSELIANLELDNLALSRGDSDDCIASNYFEVINGVIADAVSKGETFDYIVSTRGYRTDGEYVQEIYYSCSPYLTSFHKVWNGGNIYSINHEDVLKYKFIPVQNAHWMQYLHGKNIGNSFLSQDHDEADFQKAVEKSPKMAAKRKVPASEAWPTGFHVPNI